MLRRGVKAGDGKAEVFTCENLKDTPRRTKGPKEQMFLESEMMVKLGCNSIY